MAITIHHGPNGSYKSAGVIQDRVLPCAITPCKEFPKGRTVVTNIKGITLEKFYEVYGERVLPEFNIINVDTRTEAGIAQLLKFWHWIPLGALLVIDEAQLVFLKKYRDADLDKLAYKTIEEATAENRPHSWLIAWTEHRHWNWDIILMTPDIDYLREDIRLTTEGAYLHANAAIIGFKGRYKEGYHKAKHSGLSVSHILGTQGKKIKPDVFRLYLSTQTGSFTDTPNGINLFKSPRLFVAFSLLAGALVLLSLNGGVSVFSEPGVADTFQSDQPQGVAVSETGLTVPVQASAPPRLRNRDSLGSRPAREVDVSHPLGKYSLSIKSRNRFGERYVYQVQVIGEDIQPGTISSNDLLNLGYAITPFNKCLVRIRYEAHEQLVGCKPTFTPLVGDGSLQARPSGVHGAQAGTAGSQPLDFLPPSF